MFVKFNLANYRNFKELQTITMVPSRRKDNAAGHVIEDKGSRMLNKILLYGPNSAGKSNFIRALEYFQFTVKSHLPDGDVAYVNSDGSRCNDSTYMEMVMDIDGHRYAYGFEALTDKGIVIGEWILKIDRNRKTRLVGYYNKAERDRIAEGILAAHNRDNHRCSDNEVDFDSVFYEYSDRSLILGRFHDGEDFLSGDDKVGTIAKKIGSFIRNGITVISAQTGDMAIPVKRSIIADLNSILPDFDLEIRRLVEEPFRKEEIPVNLLKPILSKQTVLRKNDHIVFVHRTATKKPWLFHVVSGNGKLEYRRIVFEDKNGSLFDYGKESMGTERLLFLLSLFESLKTSRGSGSLMAIDEIECSIHSRNTCKLIDVYHEDNCGKAQLIISTHETHLLKEPHSRPDEVWFIDPRRGSDSGSEIYPLKQYSIRVKEYREMYLDGDFMAVPLLSTPDLEE